MGTIASNRMDGTHKLLKSKEKIVKEGGGSFDNGNGTVNL